MAGSRALKEDMRHLPGRSAYAEGGEVDSRQRDFEQALNYEQHADGGCAGQDNYRKPAQYAENETH